MKKFTRLFLSWVVFLSCTAWANEDLLAKAPAGSVVHKVTVGETLGQVCSLYGVSEQTLLSLNGVDTLEGLTFLVIPPSPRGWPVHQVSPGQTLWRIGKAYGISVEQIRQANRMVGNEILPGNRLLLPRGEKPEWKLPGQAAASQPAAVPSTLSPLPEPSVSLTAVTSDSITEPTADESGISLVVEEVEPTEGEGWVEVRLPDNRRAWVQISSLVLGSWKPLSRGELIDTARRFIGVPYRWGGTNPNGYDCSGFVQEVFRLAGHSVPRLADAQYEKLEKVRKDALVPGDLVFFNTDGSGISHVGIFSGNGYFLHASSSRGVVEDPLDSSYFAARYVGAARLPGWAVDLSYSGR